MPEVIGPVRPKVAGAFKVMEATDLGGAFIKSIDAAGLATVQMADDSEVAVQVVIPDAGQTPDQVDARIAAADIATTQLSGAYIKEATTAGVLTVQQADGTESTVQIATDGSGLDQTARDAAAYSSRPTSTRMKRPRTTMTTRPAQQCSSGAGGG